VSFSDRQVQNGLLTVRSALEGDRIRLTLTGELDLSNTDTVEVALEEAGAEGVDVLVDLGPLEFIDSSGIALLVRAIGGNGAARISFLPSRSDSVCRLLHMTGLDQRLPLSTPTDGQPILPPA